jgi:hypothetical protein
MVANPTDSDSLVSFSWASSRDVPVAVNVARGVLSQKSVDRPPSSARHGALDGACGRRNALPQELLNITANRGNNNLSSARVCTLPTPVVSFAAQPRSTLTEITRPAPLSVPS